MGLDHIVFHAICFVKHFSPSFPPPDMHNDNVHTGVTLKSHPSAPLQLQTSAFVVALEQQLLVAGVIFSVVSMKDSCRYRGSASSGTFKSSFAAILGLFCSKVCHDERTKGVSVPEQSATYQVPFPL